MTEPNADELGGHLVPDAERVAVAISELRGEMNLGLDANRAAVKLGMADMRLEMHKGIEPVALAMGRLEEKADGIIRRQDYTNSKVSEHDSAIGAILKRNEERDTLDKIRRAQMAERYRLVRLAWQGWRALSRHETRTVLLVAAYIVIDRVAL